MWKLTGRGGPEARVVSSARQQRGARLLVVCRVVADGAEGRDARESAADSIIEGLPLCVGGPAGLGGEAAAGRGVPGRGHQWDGACDDEGER